MHLTGRPLLRIAILDLYQGAANQGMRCIQQILQEWSSSEQIDLSIQLFDVRQRAELPGLEFDVYISTGGPGDPLSSRYEDWDIQWCRWLDRTLRHNANPNTSDKKFVFFICHSFHVRAVAHDQLFENGKYDN